MVPHTLIIASRKSPLALIQTREALQAIRPLFPANQSFETVAWESPGDRDQKTLLSDPDVPDDFFTRDIDEALIRGDAHLAVHSAKDVPQTLRPELTVAALLRARDIRDALVHRAGCADDETPRRIGTSSAKRDQEIRRLYPEADIQPLRGTIQQRLDQLDRGDFDAIVVAACALERLDLAHRITRHLDYDPVPQQGRLAIVARNDQSELLAILRRVDVRHTAGLVALVGCPADPSLISARAERYIKHADIILHDRLVPDDILLAIRDKAVAVGKVGGAKSITHNEIQRRMLMEAEQGRLVVRLHGGDPAIFAHLSEELEFLSAWDIRADIIPALTAAQVAAAKAHTALTHKGSGGSITLFSGHVPADGPPETIPGPDRGNLAIYMGVSAMPDLRTRLLQAGWAPDAPVAIGERLGYRDESIRFTSVDQLAEQTIERPAVTLVGVKPWPIPTTTLFVGTDPEQFLKYGPLIHWPLIKLVARPLTERVAVLDETLARVDGVIFPSRFAVRSFMEALMQRSDARALHGKRLLAVGPSTAEELSQYGLRADGAADNWGGIQALKSHLGADFAGNYLYPCSDQAPQQERIDSLREHQIDLTIRIFYNNRTISYNALPRMPFHRVLFTSTSAVNAYFTLYPHELKQSRIWLAVGPSTLKAIQHHGLAGEML